MLDSTDYARYLMQDAIAKGYLKNFNLESNLYNKILDIVGVFNVRICKLQFYAFH